MKVDVATMYRVVAVEDGRPLAPPPLIADDDDLDSAMPREMRNWLVRLRLLEGVPFAYLVADTELLPPESIRWFYLDRRWTDALVQGALRSARSTATTARSSPPPTPRSATSSTSEERNVRRRAGHAAVRRRRSTPISGFLLRSQAVSGWPGLHVRAFNVDPAEARQRALPRGRPAADAAAAPRAAGAGGAALPVRRHPDGRAHRGAAPGRPVRLRRDASDGRARSAQARATPTPSQDLDAGDPGRRCRSASRAARRGGRHPGSCERRLAALAGTGAGDGLDARRVRAAAASASPTGRSGATRATRHRPDRQAPSRRLSATRTSTTRSLGGL